MVIVGWTRSADAVGTIDSSHPTTIE